MPETFDFSEALKRLKAGRRVQRLGWNGKGMWLEFVPADSWSTSVGPSGACRLPWLGIKTVNGGFVPWLASQIDMLAEDWLAT